MSKGKVFLVGAGPGDPKLLTLRAVEVLAQADVVMYDRLIGEAILEFARNDARKVNVGKRPHCDGITQSEINLMMISEARQGRTVVRLKGGDPLFFSRGAEEAQALRNEGIKFEIVPGVTSAIAASDYSGIPLSHRTYSSSVAIVTGHEDPSKVEGRVKWGELAKSVDTIVILMAVERLNQIAAKLINEGALHPETPVAAIESATTENQKTVLFTLGEAADGAVHGLISAPCIIVVGKVVGMATDLNWLSPNSLFRVTSMKAR